MKKILLFSFCTFVSLGVIAADPTEQDLKKVESQLEQERQAQKESKQKANQMEKEVREVQKKLVSSAKQIQNQEGKLSLLEQKKKELEEQIQDLRRRLNLSNKQFARLLKGLQTLALRPTELLIFQTKTPIEMFRSRNLMRYSLPIIGHVQEQTKEDLAQLANSQNELNEKIVQIQKAHTDLVTQREKMDRLVKQKKVLQAQYTSFYNKSKKKAEELAAKAQDLKDLLAQLEQKYQEEQKRKSILSVVDSDFRGVKGQLSFPANGRIIQHFGETSISGAHTKGIVVQTRPEAQVTIPYDGIVLFAGPFQNYGRLLIVDHGDEYLTVLAGMGTINVSVGQELLAGEPVGAMGYDYKDLYLEIRHQGTPEDPEPWFKRKG